MVNAENSIAMLPPEVRKHAHKRPMPAWFSPMLATLVAKPFSAEGWLYEPKLDGERCLVFYNGKNLRLFSRNHKSLNDTYPELLDPLSGQASRSYILDGEIVAFKGDVTSFSQLQRRMQVRNPAEAKRRGVEIFYYLFDLLYLNGYDLRDVPLIHRKQLLEQTFDFLDPMRYTDHREREGEPYYRQACRKGMEGIIAKRADSPYVPRRSRDWLKFKCWAEQEFVIGGYTDPRGARSGFGALLLGYYKGNGLVYAGKVGTGFDSKTLNSLGRKLASLETKNSPFEGVVKAGKGVYWVRPKLVAQVAFTEWTHDGKLRHPRFLGIRTDKDPREVVRERAQ
jgi:DNA ligase D-like protein (predicted ligase)